MNLPPPSDLPPLTLVGRGKLGTAVRQAWERAGGHVARAVGAGEAWEPSGVVFEATSPDAAAQNLLRCATRGVPVVTGTTGWFERLEDVERAAIAHGAVVFWSTNFSPGVHALNAIARHAAEVFGRLDGYTARITETHHVHKVDAPSGTALTLAQHVSLGNPASAPPIESIRQGDVIGLHALAWESDHDAVVLQHEAKTREGFALGAVTALRFAWAQHVESRAGVYTMNDLFST